MADELKTIQEHKIHKYIYYNKGSIQSAIVDYFKGVIGKNKIISILNVLEERKQIESKRGVATKRYYPVASPKFICFPSWLTTMLLFTGVVVVLFAVLRIPAIEEGFSVLFNLDPLSPNLFTSHGLTDALCFIWLGLILGALVLKIDDIKAYVKLLKR